MSDEQPDTRSMWGDMFGLGPLLKMATDPQMIADAARMMHSMTIAVEALPRVEAKLDLLLKAQGHDIEQINRSVHEWIDRTAVILDGNGAHDGLGQPRLASRAADNGSGRAPKAAGRHDRLNHHGTRK